MIEDLEGYAEMMNHPAHLEVDRNGLPLVDRFASFDITDDPDPEIGTKIAKIHRRRHAAAATAAATPPSPTSPSWSPNSPNTPAAPPHRPTPADHA